MCVCVCVCVCVCGWVGAITPVSVFQSLIKMILLLRAETFSSIFMLP